MTTKTDAEFLVVVDIQPGYYQACHRILPAIIERLNNTQQKIIFFYVGPMSDLDNKYDVISFLLEHGLDEYRLDDIKFIEKDYGFLRNWMDTGVNEDTIINAVKLMREHKINDTNDFTDEIWEKLLTPVQKNLRFEESMNYPDFDKRLIQNDFVNNIELIGGSRHECLEEINLYLKSLGKTTTVNDKLCYGADSFVPKHKQVSKKKM